LDSAAAKEDAFDWASSSSISGGGLLEKLLLSFAAAALFVLVARCFVGGFTIVGAYGAGVER
jgi:hypothetical protein